MKQRGGGGERPWKVTKKSKAIGGCLWWLSFEFGLAAVLAQIGTEVSGNGGEGDEKHALNVRHFLAPYESLVLDAQGGFCLSLHVKML